jgi:hypothetical protein
MDALDPRSLSIISLMPPHETYIETHLGGGAIMRRRAAAAINIGIVRSW